MSVAVDPMDLVRRVFRALNAGDVDGVSACYSTDCIVEHVFVDDDDTIAGRDAVTARWRADIASWAGALDGGRRYDVGRVASLETGWGWVRAEWTRALRSATRSEERRERGYSHFWIEDGRIRRHRSVVVASRGDAPGEDAASGDSQTAPRERRYPTRPIVGVGAVVFDDDGRVLLVKRAHEPLAGQWSLPGGTLEIGETLEAGVAREIHEETGLVIDVGAVVEVFDRILVDETGRVRYHFVLIDYLCRAIGGVLAAGSDVSDARFVPAAELAAWRVTDKVHVVVERALAMRARVHE